MALLPDTFVLSRSMGTVGSWPQLVVRWGRGTVLTPTSAIASTSAAAAATATSAARAVRPTTAVVGAVLLCAGWARTAERRAGGRRRQVHGATASALAPRVARRASPLGDGAKMRLFLDTADEAEWDRLLPLGFFYGVTTNPVLLERAGLPCSLETAERLFKKAVSFPGIQEVMFQAWGASTEKLVASARNLQRLPENLGRVVVKLPLTREGVRAAAELRESDPSCKLCMTTCYSATQGFVAAGLGADYIAPYLGRMGDLGMDGIEECCSLQATVGGPNGDVWRNKSAEPGGANTLTRSLRTNTRVLVASIRSAQQMVTLAGRGLDTFTFSPKICDELLDVEATTLAASDFERAARAAGGG
mmetsp:Transcript_77996/g.253060  ORF Transcript_77996/g.253060 Transcript_77996/m.253060 type:complete len:361 (+) Transcript_77996:141-1223(+)